MNRSFVYGIIFAFLVLVLAQDVVGKENYLQMASDGWIDTNPLIWVLPIITVFLLGRRK